MRNYLYKAFGVVFSVPFPIEGLDEVIGQPMISVKFGDTPEKLENVLKKGVLYQLNHEGFLFEFDKVGRYWAKRNGEVFITKDEKASTADIIVFLFSSVFAYLLQNIGLLTLHANVVCKDSLAYLIAGHSGAGKSTLTYELMQNGYTFFSDDIAAISFDEDDRAFVAPGLPRLKLWEDALNHFSVEKNGLRPIRNQLEKYYYSSPIPYNDDRQIKKMVILANHNKSDFVVEKLTGADKFTALKANTYRYQFLSEENGIKPHFALSAKLINTINIYRVTRPNFDFKLDLLKNEIEKIFVDEQ